MPRNLLIILFLSTFAFTSCRHEGQCSGLNPELATYNTSKRLRKGVKSLHSAPEREAHRHRVKSMKQKSGLKSKSAYSGHGIFHFHLGGGHAHASGHVSAGAKS